MNNLRDNKGRFIKGHEFTEEMLIKMRSHGNKHLGNSNGFIEGMIPWNKGKYKNGITYRNIHKWVEQEKRKAKICSFNNNHISLIYDWANISKSYLQDVNDWSSLCRKCHKQYDKITGGRSYASLN